MSAVLQPTTAPPIPAPPRTYATTTLSDLLHRLGDILPSRVRLDPPPGTATLADLDAVNEQKLGQICEWVEGTLVEKAMGAFESWLGAIISGEFYIYLNAHDIGMLVGEAGVLRILPEIGRAGDVTFLSWARLPGGRPPPRADRIPAVVPDLVVEVLSESNTRREMARKRDEYFRAGVRQVWEIDPESRAANVYTAVDQMTPVPADGTLDGGDILPGFTLSLRAVFERAERMGGGRSPTSPPAG